MFTGTDFCDRLRQASLFSQGAGVWNFNKLYTTLYYVFIKENYGCTASHTSLIRLWDLNILLVFARLWRWDCGSSGPWNSEHNSRCTSLHQALHTLSTGEVYIKPVTSTQRVNVFLFNSVSLRYVYLFIEEAPVKKGVRTSQVSND